jgi:hypothetical protein
MNDRERIGQGIINLCAGTRHETALLAQIDALATVIGGVHHLTGHSLAEAEDVAREAGERILEHIRKNWGEIEVAQ